MRRRWPISQLVVLLLAVGGGGASLAGAGEILALDGRTLSVPQPSGEFRQSQEEHLAAARLGLAENESDPEAWIWVGRRLAYLGRYDEALDIFSQGVKRFPTDARFLRHRGHRYISLRRLDDAIADFTLAAGLAAGRPDPIEPDGLPNARGIPTSTLKTNIWYHLGLAHYLKGDFESAVEAYQRCSALAANADMLVAADYWLYLALRRAGREEAAAELLAALPQELDLIENDGYYELLQLFASDAEGRELLAGASGDTGLVAFPTTAYGVAAWQALNGHREQAADTYRLILASPAITAFGYIAAEAEVARLVGE